MKGFKDALIGGLPLLVAASAVMVGVTAIGAADLYAGTTLEKTKPSNAAPAFETHRATAERVCSGAVVAPDSGQLAAAVVVIKLDGSAVRMDTSDAFDRQESKTDADDVWVIGVCKRDLR